MATQINAIRVQASLPANSASSSIFALKGYDGDFTNAVKAALADGFSEPVANTLAFYDALQALPASLRAKIVDVRSPRLLHRLSVDQAKADKLYAADYSNSIIAVPSAASAPILSKGGYNYLDFAAAGNGMQAVGFPATLVHNKNGFTAACVFKPETAAVSTGAGIQFNTAFSLYSRTTDTTSNRNTRPDIAYFGINEDGNLQMFFKRSQDSSEAAKVHTTPTTLGQAVEMLLSFDGTVPQTKFYKDNSLIFTDSHTAAAFMVYDPLEIDIGAYYGALTPAAKLSGSWAFSLVCNASITDDERNALSTLVMAPLRAALNA